MKDGELSKENPDLEIKQGNPFPSNLVEVETPSETWKTEFKDEISSLRINGEDVSKIHRAMKELREMRDSSDRTLRRLILLITLLLCSGLGVGVYALDYLLQFNAEKIDKVIDLNLQAIKKSEDGMIKIPLIAISLLEKHPNEMRWDANQSIWTFWDTFRGKRMKFSQDHMFYSPNTIENLGQELGLFWNGDTWNWPKGFEPKKY
jgi:hypothetical protein